jgi:hypothetical protein
MTRVALVFFPLSVALAGTAFADTPAAPPPRHQTRPTATVRHDRPNPQEERMTNALNLLEAKACGYFKDFSANGKNCAATVTAKAKPITVVIDPDTDQVTRRG